jgi:deoxyhypusine synthase
MTEYNYFCWSEKVNDENSFQQKRYRVFNTEVSKDEYVNIKKIYHKIELNSSDDYEVRFQNGFRKMWNTLSKEEKQEYLDIPHFDMK